MRSDNNRRKRPEVDQGGVFQTINYPQHLLQVARTEAHENQSPLSLTVATMGTQTRPRSTTRFPTP